MIFFIGNESSTIMIIFCFLNRHLMKKIIRCLFFANLIVIIADHFQQFLLAYNLQ